MPEDPVSAVLWFAKFLEQYRPMVVDFYIKNKNQPEISVGFSLGEFITGRVIRAMTICVIAPRLSNYFYRQSIIFKTILCCIEL